MYFISKNSILSVKNSIGLVMNSIGLVNEFIFDCENLR